VYFLRTVWGIFLHTHTQPDAKKGIKKILKTFTYYFCTISNLKLTKFDFPLPHDKTSRSEIWQMTSEKSSVGLSRLLWTMSDICKVSDGTRVVGKCLGIFWYLALGQVMYGNREIYPKPWAFFLVQGIYNFSTERIVALRSVNKISWRATIPQLLFDTRGLSQPVSVGLNPADTDLIMWKRFSI
jgi:hypothetical protein